MMHDYTIIKKVKFPKDDETVQIYSPQLLRDDVYTNL